MFWPWQFAKVLCPRICALGATAFLLLSPFTWGAPQMTPQQIEAEVKQLSREVREQGGELEELADKVDNHIRDFGTAERQLARMEERQLSTVSSIADIKENDTWQTRAAFANLAAIAVGLFLWVLQIKRNGNGKTNGH